MKTLFIFQHLSKNVEVCHETTSRIVKVIRLKYEQLSGWIEDTDIKVKIFFMLDEIVVIYSFYE